MPVPHLILANVLLGMLAAWSGRSVLRLASRSSVAGPYFVGFMIAEALLVLPVGLYILIFYPDWSSLYLVETAEVPSAIAVLLLVAFPGVGAVGFFGGVVALRANKDRAVLGALGVGAAALLLGIVLSWSRIVAVGTYDQFHRRFGLEPLHTTGLGIFLLVALPVVAAGLGFMFLRLSRERP